MTEPKPNHSNIKPEKAARKKVPKKITESYLHNAGLYYLERFATSSHNFHQVMLRKVRKSCLYHKDQDLEACRVMVEALVLKFERAGLLNDSLYLEGMVRSYRRRGLSSRMILQKLGQKGLKEADILTALNRCDADMLPQVQEQEQQSHPDLIAAARYCRSKKLGAFTPDDRSADPAVFQKQMGKLARAGFSYETAQTALNAPRDELESLLAHSA